jgi:hypothetical protein
MASPSIGGAAVAPGFCPSCGKPTDPGASFCAGCGAPLVALASESARSNRKLLLVAAAAVAVLALSGFLFLQGRGGSASDTHTIQGTLTFVGGAFTPEAGGSDCVGFNLQPFEGIHKGVGVTLHDDKGGIVGSADLQLDPNSGKPDPAGHDQICVFDFTVANVREAPFYTVIIGGKSSKPISLQDVEKAGWRIDLQ